MATSQANGPELLRREILEEAHRQEEEILRHARETGGALTAKAEREAEQARKEKMDAARAEAKRRQEAILATVSVGTSRMRLARIEELLREIHDRARQRLQNSDGLERRQALAGLAARALGSMAGNRFVMRLAGVDFRLLGNGLADEVRRRGLRPGIELRVEAGSEIKGGSCVLLDEEGRQMWDIGLEARLERLWPELRRQIAAQVGLVEKAEGDGL